MVSISLVLLGCTGPGPKPVSDLISKLDEMNPRLLGQYRVPGAAVALIHNGDVVWVHGYGLADKAEAVPVTPHTVFQVGSVSKPVAAWGVMRLVEMGRIDLDAPVDTYLTRWHLPPSEFDHDGVTVRRVLGHTAGLSLHGYPGFHPDQPLPTLEESLSGATGGSGDVRVAQVPGSGFRYSGGGYTLLQLLVEEVTGEDFAAYMEREVLAPLGMTDSSFEWTPRLRPATAIAYDHDEQPVPNYLFTAKAAAGLYTTASDMARFVAAGMPGSNGEPAGRGVLSPDTVALMFAFRSEAGGSFGLGYAIGVTPGGDRGIHHGGSNVGWKALIAAVPDKGTGIVVLTNGDNGPYLQRHIELAWCEWLYPGKSCLPG